MASPKMPNLNFKIITATFLLMSSTAFATSPCDYTADNTVEYQGSIESVRSVKKEVWKVNPDFEDIRKCVISLDAQINGKWYPTKGEYMFGPDMSETKACSFAENRAKVNIIRKMLPEKLTGKKNLKCVLTNTHRKCSIINGSVYMKTNIGRVKIPARLKSKGCEKI